MKNSIEIINIFWKRTYLFVEYNSMNNIDLYIKNIENNKLIKMENKYLDDKKCYRAKMNITIAEDNLILSSGNYIFTTGKENENIKVNNCVLKNIEEISRVFRYGENNYAYIASFDMQVIDDNEKKELKSEIAKVYKEEEYKIILKINFMKKNKHPKKRNIYNVLLESKNPFVFFKKLFFLVAKDIIKIYFSFLTYIFPKNGKKVLFMSENRVKIMDNLEAIDKRIKERGLDKKFKISYSFRNIFNKRQNPFEWLKVLTLIAKQDYIFVDDYAPILGYIKLHKKTVLVQTWHAGFGFKLVGYGRFGINGSPHPYNSCHRNYTYGIIGNENLKEIYSEVWGIGKDKLLPVGLPRLEHFLDKKHIEETQESFYKEFPQFKGKNIITFAPTYRGQNQLEADYDYELINFDKLYEYCKNNNSIVLFGKHHFIKREIPIKEEHKDLIYDFSKYKLNDVFYITDILITDYSSAFYDFLLLKKPVIFYVYDKDLYSATRGVHRPIEKVAPGKICITFDEVLSALKNKDFNNVEMKNFLNDRCLTNKVLSSDKIINYILLKQEVDFYE